MEHRYLAFDIEIFKVLPKGFQDWRAYRPLGISCAATHSDEEQPKIWHSFTAQGEIADQLSRDDAEQLVKTLTQAKEKGYTILTWNGLGFDFDILAEESGMGAECQQLALDHVDMMFHLFCQLGYALALDRAARGMGLPGKPAGMSGELAPLYWSQGRRREVLAYVAQDVRITLDLAKAVDERKALYWQSKQGVHQQIPLPGGWFTVQQAIALPEPDTSWMARPWPRSRFTGWIKS